MDTQDQTQDPDVGAEPLPGAAEPPAEGGAQQQTEQTEQTEPPAKATAEERISTDRPENVNGWYVLLAATEIADLVRGETPPFKVAAYVKASGPARAKELLMADKTSLGDRLRDAARVEPGIILRAVAAMYWEAPATLDYTTFFQPPPVLKIG